MPSWPHCIYIYSKETGQTWIKTCELTTLHIQWRSTEPSQPAQLLVFVKALLMKPSMVQHSFRNIKPELIHRLWRNILYIAPELKLCAYSPVYLFNTVAHKPNRTGACFSWEIVILGIFCFPAELVYTGVAVLMQLEYRSWKRISLNKFVWFRATSAFLIYKVTISALCFVFQFIIARALWVTVIGPWVINV